MNRERPRSVRMQYRFLKSVIYAVWLFARMIFWDIYVAKWFSGWAERTQIKRWSKYARGFRGFAISMGGVMIKLGQFASTRADILPEEVIGELASLQDEVPSIPYDKIKAVIETELGRIENRYKWINEEPVAAASLGQVHRGQLLNDDRVVVKVQRPNIREIVYTDLAALMVVARLAMRFQFVRRRADTVALAEEFGRVLLEEVSYRKEAENAKQFGAMFKQNKGVYIPSVYHDHSTDIVLTLEDVTTCKINDYERMEASGISRKAVAKRLLDTYMVQIFEHRMFHADPHPGNLFVYPLPVENEAQYIGKGGRPFYLIFVDFGMTGTLTPELTKGMTNTLAAVLTRDAKMLVESYDKLGFFLPDADKKRIEEAVEVAFNQVWGLSMTEMREMDFEKAREIGEEFNDLLFDMPFRVPQDFVYLGRTVGILSGMATSLDPDFNPWSEMQGYMQKLITSNDGNLLAEVGSGLRNPFMSMLANGPQGLFRSLRNILLPQMGFNNEALTLLRQIVDGEVQIVTKPSSQYRYQLRRIETQSRRTTRAMLFGSFLIASTLLYTNGDTNLATLGFVICGVLGIGILLARA